VTGLFAAKLAWEHFAGPLPFTAASLAVPVVHEAHTYGRSAAGSRPVADPPDSTPASL